MKTLLIALFMFQAPPAPQTPGDVKQLVAEADALFAKQENERALELYGRATSIDPKRADLHIARGRTLQRLRRFDEAFAAYSEAIRLEPQGWAGYRYRGHAYINVRRFGDAIPDLEKAAALTKEDFNVYYHLGLAHYLLGRFDAAAGAFQECLRTAKSDEDIVSGSAWLYPSLKRAGRDREAQEALSRITPKLTVKENAGYLDRLLLFKGLKTEQEVADTMQLNPLNVASVGYSIGLWHLLNGRADRAREYFRKATTSDYWPAFGHVAAETELKRLGAGG